MSQFKSFQKFVQNNRDEIKVKGVAAKFPYQWTNKTAYLVTFKGVTQYLFFNGDGKMLQQQQIKE